MRGAHSHPKWPGFTRNLKIVRLFCASEFYSFDFSGQVTVSGMLEPDQAPPSAFEAIDSMGLGLPES